MSKKSKIFEYIVLIFLFLQPWLDAITCIQLKNNLSFITISSLVRGLFFCFALFYLIKSKINFKYLCLFMGHAFIFIIYTLVFTSNSITRELANLLQIFYLPVLLLFFQNIKNSKINTKFILLMNFIYLSLIIVPYFLKFGYYISDFYEEKKGFIGLFYGGNEISNILVGLFPISLGTLKKEKNIFIKISYFIALIFSTILIGTKTLMLGVLLTLIYNFIKEIKCNFSNFRKSTKVLIFLIPALTIIGICIILPFTPLYQNILTTINFFNINFSNLFSMYTLDKLIFSGRLSFFQNMNNIFINQNFISYLFGLGITTTSAIKLIEIDIFDIFYSIGILGIIVYIILMITSLKNIKFHNSYKFTFFLLIFISLIAGHVLTSTAVSIYLCILPLLKQNSQ